MKGLVLAISLVVSGFAMNANAAQPYVCVESVSDHAENFYEDGQIFTVENLAWDEEGRVYLAKYTCEDLSRIGTGLEVASMVVQAGTLYMACTSVTPPGAAVTVTLQGTVLGLRFLKVVVGNLPCESTDAKMEAKVKGLVCDEMNRQGIACKR